MVSIVAATPLAGGMVAMHANHLTRRLLTLLGAVFTVVRHDRHTRPNSPTSALAWRVLYGKFHWLPGRSGP